MRSFRGDRRQLGRKDLGRRGVGHRPQLLANAREREPAARRGPSLGAKERCDPNHPPAPRTLTFREPAAAPAAPST